MDRNPFDPETGPGVLSFFVREEGNATVSVHTLDGFRVRVDTLSITPGPVSWSWDGEGDAGPCPTGTYVVIVETPEGSFSANVAVMR